jgi:hypothetical protein
MKPLSDNSMASEQQEKDVARDHRREYQGKMNQTIQKPLPGEISAR